MQLLPIIHQAFPNVVGYENLQTVIQANAEGHVVQLIRDNDNNNDVCGSGNGDDPTIAFVKQVDVAQYVEKKSWPDLRRTLMYLRTEVRFYREVIPQLLLASSSSSSSTHGAFPHLYTTNYNLDGLLTEEEAATDPVGPEPTDLLSSIMMKKQQQQQQQEEEGDDNSSNDKSAVEWNEYGGYIVMEGISSEEYYQDSPISLDQAKETLSAVAALHASAWENEELLTMAQNRLSRGSYHLFTRNPKELAEMPQAWENFKANFGIDYDNGKYQPLFDECKDMGRRIQSLAEYVCDQTSPSAASPYATLSHGDFKAMNCFLPKIEQCSDDTPKGGNRGVVIVDFASTGVGLGMSDVAMHIHHAVRPHLLANGGEEMLVDHYLSVLNRLLQTNTNRKDSTQPVPTYPRDVALMHYRLAVVDYARFFLGRFWKSATPESFSKKKDSKNTALINRDVDAAMAFLGRVQKYVTMIESDRASSVNAEPS